MKRCGLLQFLVLGTSSVLWNQNNNISLFCSCQHRGCELRLKDLQDPTPALDASGLRGGASAALPPNTFDNKCQSNGIAGGQYPCKNVDLISHISAQQLNQVIGSKGNVEDELSDVWGWSKNNREFALVCLYRGVAFVEVSFPVQPVYLGVLKFKNNGGSMWCDVKVYRDHAYIVTENNQQGMQIFDLTSLLVASPNTLFAETSHFDGNTNAHNLFINGDTGFGYIVGSNKCSGGLYMFDLKGDPASPEEAGCFADDGYTHDVQCVVYDGSDAAYRGREICFACNEDTVTIVDVTDKSNPRMISASGYDDAAYTHQGWLSEDHDYFVFGDELDETQTRVKTTTLVLDVRDLKNPPPPVSYVSSTTTAVDHNQYVKGNYVYQANYRAGMRILRANDFRNARLEEVAYFDIYPIDDAASFNGAWSVYPFFRSGIVAVSGIEQGLFLLQVDYSFPIPTTTTTTTPPTTTPPTTTPPTTTIIPPVNTGGAVIYSEGFEKGFGQFNSDITNVKRISIANRASAGDHSLRLQFQTTKARLYTTKFDVAKYKEVTIEFSFLTRDFKNTDFFIIQTKNENNGYGNFWNFWKTENSYEMGKDFPKNNIHYKKYVTVNTASTKSIAVAFRNKAKIGQGDVFLDGFKITGRT